MAITFDGTRVSSNSKFSSEFTAARVLNATNITIGDQYPRFEVEVEEETSPAVPPKGKDKGKPAVYDKSSHIIMAFQLPQELVTGHGTAAASFDDEAFKGMVGTRKITGKKNGWLVTDCNWE